MQMPQMSPEQALVEVDQVCADAERSRAQHVVLQTAVQILRQVLTERVALGKRVQDLQAHVAEVEKECNQLRDSKDGPKDDEKPEDGELLAVEGEKEDEAPAASEAATG